MGAIRVLTVDDHSVFRKAVRALVAATDGFELAGEAVSGGGGVGAACRLAPDLVLLDVRLPDIDGYEVARRIAPRQPAAVIVLVSATDEALQGAATSRCSAVAFVRKEDLRPDLLRELWSAYGPHAATHR